MTDHGGCMPDTPTDLDFAIQRFAEQRSRADKAERQLAHARKEIECLKILCEEFRLERDEARDECGELRKGSGNGS